MKCGEAKKQFVDFAGNELPMEETARLKKHLAECPSCRAACGRLTGAIDFINSERVRLPDELTADAFSERVMERASAKERGIAVFSPALRTRFVLASVAVAALLAILIIPRPDYHKQIARAPDWIAAGDNESDLLAAVSEDNGFVVAFVTLLDAELGSRLEESFWVYEESDTQSLLDTLDEYELRMVNGLLQRAIEEVG